MYGQTPQNRLRQGGVAAKCDQHLRCATFREGFAETGAASVGGPFAPVCMWKPWIRHFDQSHVVGGVRVSCEGGARETWPPGCPVRRDQPRWSGGRVSRDPDQPDFRFSERSGATTVAEGPKSVSDVEAPGGERRVDESLCANIRECWGRGDPSRGGLTYGDAAVSGQEREDDSAGRCLGEGDAPLD